jgi:hypothetical protein
VIKAFKLAEQNGKLDPKPTLQRGGSNVEYTHHKMAYFPAVPSKWDILFLF